MEYGNLHMRINEILQEKGISKNKICRNLDIPRSNFNKYYHDGVSRFVTGLMCKLCWYLNIEVGELIEYKRPEVLGSVKKFVTLVKISSFLVRIKFETKK